MQGKNHLLATVLAENSEAKLRGVLQPTGADETGKGKILTYTIYNKGFLWVREKEMKIILWIIAIIFIVGLLTLTGVFKLIF